MSSAGEPEIPGVASWYDRLGNWLSTEVDLVSLFGSSAPLDIVFRAMGDYGLNLRSRNVRDTELSRVASLDFMTEIWNQVPERNVVRFHTDPVVGRRWLYANRFADMILEMLPRVTEMLPRATKMTYPAGNVRCMRFKRGAKGFERWAAGQSWAAFVAEAPAPFVTKVDRTRVEAIRILQKWLQNPYPIRLDSKEEPFCFDGAAVQAWRMILGPHPNSERMALERALLYTAAGLGVAEARSVEFGAGAPADEVLQTMVALRNATL